MDFTPEICRIELKIVPIITERSHPADINKRYLHWKNNLSACEQCGSSTIPEIEKATTLSEIAKKYRII